MTSPVADALFVCMLFGVFCTVLGGCFFGSMDDFKPSNRKLARYASFALLAVGVAFLGIFVVWHLKNLFGAW